MAREFFVFISGLPEPHDWDTCTPREVLRFVANKDITGRGSTQVHDIHCEYVGKGGVFSCVCPHRLSLAYVKRIIAVLKEELQRMGRGVIWDSIRQVGNPAVAPEVVAYVSGIVDEQAEAHVPVRQAVPIFPEKVAGYWSRELLQRHITHRAHRERFLLLLDQAFFLLQYFTGEMGGGGGGGGDLPKLLVQEVFRTPERDALVIQQTYGKTRLDRKCVV